VFFVVSDKETTIRARAIETILYGGLAIGVLDMLDALAFFGWYLDLGAQRVFPGVSAGLLGPEAAREGGWLGLFLHYVTAFCVAVVYYAGTRVLPVTLRHPIAFGLSYGVVVHFVMQCVVIPLSAIHRWPPTFPLASTLNGVIGHALLVGLPVALIATWSATKNLQAKS
jgi:hypothetical protein